jgi:hypothetical protein
VDIPTLRPNGQALHSAPQADPRLPRWTETARIAATISAQLKPLWVPGGLRELRIIGTSQGTVAAFCTTPQAVAEIAAPFVGRAQLYLTCNLVDATLPERLGHAINRLLVKPTSLSGDADIVRRVLVFVDVDPVRDPHLSATEAEHRVALDRVDAISAWLIAHEISADSMMTLDSGNGGYVLPRVDLPNTPEAAHLVARFTRAIATGFTDAIVKVDGSLTNAARIMKLPGTLAMKGPNTPDRPHRRARIIRVPDAWVPIPESLLQEIGALGPGEPASSTGQPQRQIPYDGLPFDLDAWLEAHAAHLPPLSATWRDWRTADGIGRKRHFQKGCPFGADHERNNAAFIGVRPDGAVVVSCLHDRCRGLTWSDLRDLRETSIIVEVSCDK